MTVPPPAAPPQDSKKTNNKTVMYVLLGCGGCLLVGGLVTVALLVIGGRAAQQELGKHQSTIVAFQAVALQAGMATYLSGDQARLDRADALFEELQKDIEAGKATSEQVQELNEQFEAATRDNKLTGDEADAILDGVEKLTAE